MKVRKKGRSEIKREAILVAAKQAFQEFGVQNTSMDKLSAMAEVSKRTVYNHFESKEAIVMELLSELWRTSMADHEVAGLVELDLEQQLVALLESEINVVTDPHYVDLAKVALGYFFYKPDELKEQEEKMSKQETALFRWLNEQAEKQALAMDDIVVASTQLHSLVKGSAFWPQVLGMKASLSKQEARVLAEQTARLFMSQYRV
ncbi:TetR/AcrR family transcriptional regulator [Vibrio coralliilyticus]|uniref:TetR/AcrR family transcriptional regulator n=1 Tax=Vibrio coralliilyticus TaxID=190893 RepID=UPI0015615BDD|nr:TetR/AcrR family transcriptional regulator [Vibrio coralliilyticus]NRF31706.1 TetR/AcrR family transcriptional regulator [Vibrio coralliilyticus]NRF53804.1 TetR/AcrR family transcriptional regulator [Vibrio coralliilyticus]NRG03816.1 TetR/AcrR family transcriptional regulator [Vibrio coralliilyticus]